MRHAIIAIFACIVVVWGVTRLRPDMSATVLLDMYHWSAGLEKYYIETNFGRVSYLDGGQGPAIVFLHGIFARKEHWINMVRHMKQGHRVILLDLPGFGENDPLPAAQYDYALQVARVKSVLDQLDLHAFHLASNSMGSQIAGQIAVDWPTRVQSLALIGSPAGLDTPLKTPFQIARANKAASLVVSDRASYDARNALLFLEKPFVPWAIEHVWLQSEIDRTAHHETVWNVIQRSKVVALQQIAPSLVQPVLILWCEQDQIYHFSGLDLFLDLLPTAKGHALQNCGHLPMLDQPKSSAQIYDRFLDIF